MNKTDIEYLDYTWNPIAMRCTPVSEGCAHCWHLRMADRLAGNPKICSQYRNAYSGGNFVLNTDEVRAPMKLQQRQRIGVQFMGDLFHEHILEEWLWEIFATMAETPQHTYIIITKRPERMCKTLNNPWFWACVEGTCQKRHHDRTGEDPSMWLAVHGPLPNVIGMVTAETQEWADIRIPWLLKTDLACRGLSIEPMLGPVSFRWAKWHTYSREPGVINGHLDGMMGLSWVILGGESGHGARPMHPDWVRSVRDQCQTAGVPFFFKQWGEWAPTKEGQYNSFLYPHQGYMSHEGSEARLPSPGNGYCYSSPDLIKRGCAHVTKIGKKAAGRLLDGREWLEIPEGRP